MYTGLTTDPHVVLYDAVSYFKNPEKVFEDPIKATIYSLALKIIAFCSYAFSPIFGYAIFTLSLLLIDRVFILDPKKSINAITKIDFLPIQFAKEKRAQTPNPSPIRGCPAEFLIMPVFDTDGSPRSPSFRDLSNTSISSCPKSPQSPNTPLTGRSPPSVIRNLGSLFSN